MRFTLDTNILIYPLDSSAPDKQAIARDLMRRSRDADLVLTAQALGEFVNVVRRNTRRSIQSRGRKRNVGPSCFPLRLRTPMSS